jgi:hypothetical protein
MTQTANGKKSSRNTGQVPSSKMTGHSNAFCKGSVGYEIRVKDHLETYWFEWFEDWSITNLENGEVMLKSSKVDQSKLHGTLNKIRDLNLTLLLVTCFPLND